MHISIYDIISNEAEKLLSYECARYATITRNPTPSDDTFDIELTVRAISVDSSNIVFTFPNSDIVAVNIPSVNYHRIEVL